MSNELPWSEHLNMLAVHPDAANRDDVARMASELGAIKLNALKANDTERYEVMAEKHADFLCNKVFKPAFVIAFIHGAKHMRAELELTKEDKQ